MTLPQIAKYRLITQQISGTNIQTAPGMVAWFGAVQAQEYELSKWALHLRLPHLKEPDIEKDFALGKILRTHLLRPTWHFVVAEDIRWMLELTAQRVHTVNAFMYRKLELNSNIFNRCNDILIKALQGNKQLTRNQLNEEFRKKKIMAEGLRLSYITMQAELNGIICSGPKQGNQFTYSLLEERVPAFTPKTREEALAELTKRYFTSRGPATLKDFSTWSGLTLLHCKEGFEMVKSHFAREFIENETYYFPADILLSKRQFRKVCLLPVYDEFIMGYKNRESILNFRKTILPIPTFRFDNMIIFKGQIIGTWKRIIKPAGVLLEHDLFKPLGKNERSDFENAMHSYKFFRESAKSSNKGKNA